MSDWWQYRPRDLQWVLVALSIFIIVAGIDNHRWWMAIFGAALVPMIFVHNLLEKRLDDELNNRRGEGDG